MMPPAQDHKRIGDGDTGPNTGGMGAYSPCPLITPDQLADVKDQVLQRAVDGLKAEGIKYVGEYSAETKQWGYALRHWKWLLRIQSQRYWIVTRSHVWESKDWDMESKL